MVGALVNMSESAEERVYRELVRKFKERLRFALSLSPKGQNEIAREVGASNSVASDWFDEGNETLPGGKFLMRLPLAMGVSGHWLLTGQGHWYPAPTSGRKDLLFMEGMEVGARGVIARQRASLAEAEAELARALESTAARARDAFADAQASDVAARGPSSSERRGRR